MRTTATFAMLAALVAAVSLWGAAPDPFEAQWTYASETSAVIYWQCGEIKDSARSYVEYGKAQEFGLKTALTKAPRWAQFHRLTGLEPGATYFYRMVNVDPATGKETRGKVQSFGTKKSEQAIHIPEGVQGPPFVLDKPGATYLLTKDVKATGNAFEITAPDVTLDLDGHTVIFGDDTKDRGNGVVMKNKGKATVCNGHLVQGARSDIYSSGVLSSYRADPLEIFGVSTDVHLKGAYPIMLFGRTSNAKVHHNLLESRVTEIESRHYPGNALLRLDIEGGNVEAGYNVLTGGCHIGIRVSGTGPNVDIHHNDIRHHQQYVNGYALALSCPGADVHHNKVTSSGRTVHLTAADLKFHDNWCDTFGHQDLDDMPAKSRPWRHRQVELHGIKFEGGEVKNCKVYNNFMRITQKLAEDSDGKGDPADKIENGVYVRSKATALEAGKLVDDKQNWEKDRWKDCWVKYDPLRPAALIKGNDATTIFADFRGTTPGEYSIYEKWTYVPATPLNIACYDANAMNEVYGNTIVALTEYRRTRHGGYGDSGQWASAIYFVGMTDGPAEEGKYSISIHDNHFITNDLFLSTNDKMGNMTIRIEKNTFTLVDRPAPTDTAGKMMRIPPEMEAAVKGANKFENATP